MGTVTGIACSQSSIMYLTSWSSKGFKMDSQPGWVCHTLVSKFFLAALYQVSFFNQCVIVFLCIPSSCACCAIDSPLLMPYLISFKASNLYLMENVCRPISYWNCNFSNKWVGVHSWSNITGWLLMLVSSTNFLTCVPTHVRMSFAYIGCTRPNIW